MSHVLINCDHVVSWFKHEDPRFKRLYEKRQNDFANQDFGHRVCLHEAAHAVLMEMDGLKNVKFSGPEIYYNFGTDTFGGAGARVTCDDQPDAVVNDDAMLDDAKLKEKILVRAEEYRRVLYQST